MVLLLIFILFCEYVVGKHINEEVHPRKTYVVPHIVKHIFSQNPHNMKRLTGVRQIVSNATTSATSTTNPIETPQTTSQPTVTPTDPTDTPTNIITQNSWILWLYC